MKKLILAAAMAITAICSASAQAGTMATGISLGAVPSLESDMKLTNFQIGAKFQYGITDAIRAEADIEYGFKAKGVSVFDVTVNGHYLIDVANRVRVYPLIGLGYGNVKMDAGGYLKSMSFNDFLKQSGFSDTYDMLPSSAQAQVREQYKNAIEGAAGAAKGVSDSVSRFVFNVGVGGEYDLTDNLVCNLEVKYQYMKDFNRMPITIGIAYKF